MRIAIDVDDVLNNLVKRTLEVFNERTGKDYDESVFTEYNIYNCIPKEDADVIKDIWKERELWESLLPPPDAQMAVKILVNEGHEIFFVSSCSPHTWGWKSDWLHHIYPHVPIVNHICIDRKQLLNVDVLIDDNPEKLCGGIYMRILFTKPWNEVCRYTSYDYRVSNLMEAKTIIDGMEVL